MQISVASVLSRGPLTDILRTLFALAILGSVLPNVQAQPSSTTIKDHSNMQKFVIIFRQGPHPLTEADKLQRQQEVSDWAKVQNAAGHKLDPRILAPDVARPGAATAKANDVAPANWPITALLFLEAPDLAEAAKVAESHPALHFGASVEVRPWNPPVLPTTS